jgi:hypothetical protein
MKATIRRLVRGVRGRLPVDRRPLPPVSDHQLLALLAPVIETSIRMSMESTIEQQVTAPLRETSEGVARNLERIESSCAASSRATRETDLLLDGLVREVVRLQMQVECLQRLVAPHGLEPAGEFRYTEREPLPETIVRSSPLMERVLVG